MRKFQRDQRGGTVRLIVLGTVLAITIVWAQSETRPRRGASPGGSSKASRGVAVAAPVLGRTTSSHDVTPEGWGADPFDPRPLGSTSGTTGR